MIEGTIGGGAEPNLSTLALNYRRPSWWLKGAILEEHDLAIGEDMDDIVHQLFYTVRYLHRL